MGTITQDWIDAMIASVETTTMGKKTTVVLVTLTNGFELVGTSSCVDPEDYDETVGEQLALDEIKDQIWMLEGYREQLSRHAITVLAERHPAEARRVEAGPCKDCP